VLLSSYVRATRDLFSDEAQRDVEAPLVLNPEAGAIMAGTGGVRKLRVALAGRGKSGGARIIYYYRAPVGRIYLITAYAKNVRENLTQAERNAMRALISKLEGEP
jgi:hypothetical protein